MLLAKSYVILRLYRVMITEAYTSLSNTMRYYGNDTNPGAHMPFNFGLIDSLNDQSRAEDFNKVVLKWMSNMPAGGRANWVVSMPAYTLHDLNIP